MENREAFCVAIGEFRVFVQMEEVNRMQATRYIFIASDMSFDRAFTIEKKPGTERLCVVEHIPYRKKWYKGEGRWYRDTIACDKESIKKYYLKEIVKADLEEKYMKKQNCKKIADLCYRAGTGDAEAYMELAGYYLNGLKYALGRNLEMAAKCYLMAAHLGEPMAKYCYLACVVGEEINGYLH